jgi:hypothetical protein
MIGHLPNNILYHSSPITKLTLSYNSDCHIVAATAMSWQPQPLVWQSGTIQLAGCILHLPPHFKVHRHMKMVLTCIYQQFLCFQLHLTFFESHVSLVDVVCVTQPSLLTWKTDVFNSTFQFYIQRDTVQVLGPTDALQYFTFPIDFFTGLLEQNTKCTSPDQDHLQRPGSNGEGSRMGEGV